MESLDILLSYDLIWWFYVVKGLFKGLINIKSRAARYEENMR